LATDLKIIEVEKVFLSNVSSVECFFLLSGANKKPRNRRSKISNVIQLLDDDDEG